MYEGKKCVSVSLMGQEALEDRHPRRVRYVRGLRGELRAVGVPQEDDVGEGREEKVFSTYA